MRLLQILSIKALTIIFVLMYASYAKAQKFTITIAVPVIKPYLYVNQDGETTGTFVQYLKHVERHSEFIFELRVMPWARAIEEVKHSRIDALLPTALLKKRTSFLAFPEQPFIYFNNDVIVKRKGDPFKFGMKKQPARVIGKVRSMSVNPYFDKVIKRHGNTSYQTLDVASGLLMLKKQRIDLFMTDASIAKSTVAALALKEQLTIMTLPGVGEESYLAFSKNFAARHDINKIMAIILSNSPRLTE